MSEGIDSRTSQRIVADLLLGQIGPKDFLELISRLHQDWFDLCSEITDFPRCGKVSDDLRGTHMARIEAADCAMGEWLGGGDATVALRRLGSLF